MSEETTDLSDGDFVEVWSPNGVCMAWGYVRPNPQPEEDHHVVEINASFHPNFPVAQRVRTPVECLIKVEWN